jgi:hypothetical protein
LLDFHEHPQNAPCEPNFCWQFAYWKWYNSAPGEFAMKKHHDGNTFSDVAATYASELRPLLVPGDLLSMDRTPHPPSSPLAFPLPAASCACGELMSPIAQFWEHDRLWRVQFCHECHEGHACLDSIAPSSEIPVGAFVEGNSHFLRTPWQFLPSCDTAAWKDNASEFMTFGCALLP